jgi:hypothetical protein
VISCGHCDYCTQAGCKNCFKETKIRPHQEVCSIERDISPADYEEWISKFKEDELLCSQRFNEENKNKIRPEQNGSATGS